MKLAQTIQTLLTKNDMTIRDLARAINVSESTIKTWIRGSSPRSMADVRSCARHFSVSIEFLLFGEEDALPRTLEEIPTAEVFEGWVKISVHKALPMKNVNHKK